MSQTPTLVDRDGEPSSSASVLAEKFTDIANYVEECYQNRVSYELPESDNGLTDQQICFLMEEFVRLVVSVKNGTCDLG